MSESYFFEAGNSPLIISIPHMGVEVPDDLLQKMTPAGRQLADTDWHLDQFYEFARGIGASFLMARFSRYVVDLNRPPNDETLYAGQTKTGLFPQLTFRGEPVYDSVDELPVQEQQYRKTTYWKPYHDKLAIEIERLKNQHSQVLVWEAHSIASVLPRLFPGKLPDLNIGTNGGLSAAAPLLTAIEQSLATCPFTWVANGRFKGGHNTRAFGNPANGVHTIQLEMCQSTYMNEDYPFAYRPDLVKEVQPVVHNMVNAAYEAMLKI